MTKKLEEVFDLADYDVEKSQDLAMTEDSTDESTEIVEGDKIDQGLPAIRNILDNMSDYEGVGNEAVRAFRKIMSIGESAEDRHAAELFNAAARMLDTALKSSEIKDKKKLKMIELQIKKARLDADKNKNSGNDSGIYGETDDEHVVGNRNKIIEATIREVGNSQNDDK